MLEFLYGCVFGGLGATMLWGENDARVLDNLTKRLDCFAAKLTEPRRGVGINTRTNEWIMGKPREHND